MRFIVKKVAFNRRGGKRDAAPGRKGEFPGGRGHPTERHQTDNKESVPQPQKTLHLSGVLWGGFSLVFLCRGRGGFPSKDAGHCRGPRTGCWPMGSWMAEGRRGEGLGGSKKGRVSREDLPCTAHLQLKSLAAERGRMPAKRRRTAGGAHRPG